MKQILQNLKTGDTQLADVPCPNLKPGHVLIRSVVSLISAGTERMLVDFGKAGLLEKARQQPDKVKMVLDKVKTDGLVPTLEAVRNKLDQPLPMGYCNAGIVMDVGAGVTGFKVGDRVASNGKHAEVVCVPENLCARIPESVSDEAAAFTVLGAIALQGIRLVQPTLGEAVVVTGLGLIGLVTVQLLRAHGCRVMGVDFDANKLELARTFGAETVDLGKGEDPLAAAAAFSRGRGVDAVIITAATKSSEPMHQAALMCRKRGRIILVGVTGLELSRADFFEKELTFQVSCSYGPGRYDPAYEEGGQDYPFAFVRWTEQRNFEAVLDMLCDGRLQVAPFVSHRFPVAQAEQAYQLIASNASSLGVVLQYPSRIQTPDAAVLERKVRLVQHGATSSSPTSPVIGFIGAGNYATQVLIPAFKRTRAILKSVASSTGVSGVHAATKFDIAETTTDSDSIVGDASVNTVVISTRHDSHAQFVCAALAVGKHVFVEKPLCIDREQLASIEVAYQEAQSNGNKPTLMVGFNRRFAPQVRQLKALLDSVSGPKSYVMTVNAGAIPADHWTQDAHVGGGRIVGEACHFIDLLRYLAGCSISKVCGMRIGVTPGDSVRDDKASFTLGFTDGSFGTVHYLANGHKAFPKERLEVFCQGRILVLDNFRKLTGYGWPNFEKMNLWRQDKGNGACAAAFIDALANGAGSPIPFEELVEVTRATFDVTDALSVS